MQLKSQPLSLLKGGDSCACLESNGHRARGFLLVRHGDVMRSQRPGQDSSYQEDQRIEQVCQAREAKCVSGGAMKKSNEKLASRAARIAA